MVIGEILTQGREVKGGRFGGERRLRKGEKVGYRRTER